MLSRDTDDIMRLLCISPYPCLRTRRCGHMRELHREQDFADRLPTGVGQYMGPLAIHHGVLGFRLGLREHGRTVAVIFDIETRWHGVAIATMTSFKWIYFAALPAP